MDSVDQSKSSQSMRRCSVRGCNRNSLTNPGLTFHNFSQVNKGRYVFINDAFGNKHKVEQLTAWLQVLKIKLHYKGQLVCSSHFKQADFSYPDPQLGCKERRLARWAVPSLNLPALHEKEEQRTQIRNERKASSAQIPSSSDQVCISQVQETVRNETEEKGLAAASNTHPQQTYGSQYGHNGCCVSLSSNHGELDACDINQLSIRAVLEEEDQALPLGNHESVNASETVCHEASNTFPQEGGSVSHDTSRKPSGESISAGDEKMECSASANPTSNEKLEDMFGSTSKSDTSVGVQVEEKFSFVKYLKSDEELSTATGIESFKLLGVIVDCMKIATNNEYEKPSLKLKMNTENRVLMTYVKLKHNISYKFLSIIFGSVVTSQQCANIFIETTIMLSKIMKSIAIPWPSRDELRRNVPCCFQGFEDTRVVLDCTEIFIQRPKNLCCQMITYSHYKGAQTVKFMTGFTAAGLLSYMSRPYGGRCSDTSIFEQSTLLDLLEPEDAVMVDKGFLIDEACMKKKIRLIRPPFLKNSKFTTEESLQNKRIAKARVHVERFNQRIEAFDILGGFFPTSLIPIVEDIFTVICGTVNLSSPLLADDKLMTN